MGALVISIISALISLSSVVVTVVIWRKTQTHQTRTTQQKERDESYVRVMALLPPFHSFSTPDNGSRQELINALSGMLLESQNPSGCLWGNKKARDAIQNLSRQLRREYPQSTDDDRLVPTIMRITYFSQFIRAQAAIGRGEPAEPWLDDPNGWIRYFNPEPD